MGGGKDQKQANQQLASQTQYQAGQQKQFDTRNTADLDASRGRGDQLYGDLYGGFTSLAGTKPGGAAGSGAAGGGGGGGGGAPGFVPPSQTDPRYASVQGMYENFMKTGGWDPDRTKSMDENIAGFKKLGMGGMSPEDMARLRGGGVYEEFSKTGGLSDKDRANLRARGTSTIPAMYGQLNQAMQRGRTVQGGYGPGAAVMAGRLGRQQAGAMGDAALNTELGITDQVNRGRQWGTAGMTTSETALQDILSRNKIAGLQGASDTERQMVESQMGGKQWGTGGLKTLADEDRAAQERAAAAAAAASAAGAAGDRWEREFAFQQQMAGLEGLGSLYQGAGSGEYNQNKDYALGSAGTYGQAVGNPAIAQKTGNTSAWDRVGQIGGMVAGGMTGLGGLGSLGKSAGGLGTQQYKPGQGMPLWRP